ncbi:MAG TPA: hypothetical protein DDX39_04060 [Bacteroidales bacterium]|nr:MAG: hypothetical protein A2W98_09220 [Bacteroidetes bacterium GWF2_33_38]OFY84811.1 MAG: hypothetical protein A2236_13470 [Bacteroidetes bacterium RIFOXYA2_FULL_33_7]HBF87796.1 hypothetical protein [Bacteroidales bacterium]
MYNFNEMSKSIFSKIANLSLIINCFNKLIAVVLMLFMVSITDAQNFNRKIWNIPNIPGFITLKADLHMHTVFSDGTVWPSFRVEEAWSEGFDVIAITDHLGHHYKNNVDDDNFNRNYEIAKPIADKLGLILIKGTEITKRMPYGHFNALFLTDLHKVDKEDYFDALKAAAEQDAFITWNHPGWKQENDIPIWDSIHENIYKSGLMNGIEIVNKNYYYPLAFSWANAKNITLMSGSDIHDPATAEFDYLSGEHRPMTLIFSKDTSLVEIKNALLQKRTILYYNDILFGNNELLTSLFNASINIQNAEFTIDADSKDNYYNYIRIENKSCFDFDLELAEKDNILIVTDKILLKANTISIINLKPAPRDIKGEKEYVLKYKVKNLLKAPDDNIIVDFPIKITFI